MAKDLYSHYMHAYRDITLGEAYHCADSIVESPEMSAAQKNAIAFSLLYRVAQMENVSTDHHGSPLAPKDWTLPAFVRKIAAMNFEKLPHLEVILNNPAQSLMSQVNIGPNGGPDIPAWTCGNNVFTMEQAQAMFPPNVRTLVS